MALYDTKSGINAAAEFQISGLPWVISGSAGASTVKHSFDKITKRIVIKNHESAGTVLRVGFTENGVNGVGGQYYFGVDGGDIFDINVRVKEVFLKRDGAASVDYSLYSELTNIDANMMPVLTGSIGGVAYWNGVG